MTLQAVFFQFGGITTLGVNTVNMAVPAVLCYFLFGRTLHKRPSIAFIAAFACGFISVFLIGMLFVRASARAQRVHQAMLCRGFKGEFYCLREFSMSLFDWTWSVIMAVVIFGLGVLEWTKIT